MLPVQKRDKFVNLDTIQKLERAMVGEFPTMNVEEYTDHAFCAGLYARTITVPENSLIVGKMHREENFFLLLEGEMSVLDKGQIKRISAPFMSITQPGEKRVGYAHTPCVAINFHANPDDETDLALLEDRYTVPPEMERLFRAEPKRLK